MQRSALLLVCLLFSVWPQFSFAQDRITPSDRVTTRLRVRVLPDTESQIVGYLRPGESAELLESIPNWYRVRLENLQEGYVSKAWAQLVSAEAEFIRVGSWNIKKLGHGSATNFPLVAKIIDNHYDIVAIVEVMQKQQSHPGYDALLSALGSDWSGLVTDTPRPNTSDSNSEFYAILYRKAAIRPCADWHSLVYHMDNDGGPAGTGSDYFSREPAFGCFEAPSQNGQVGFDFLLAGYHARWEEGNTPAILEEVTHLKEVFQSMGEARPGENDLFITGDFNLVPERLQAIFPSSDRTAASGSTLNSSGGRTANLYDHLLVNDLSASTEILGDAEVLDIRGQASSNAVFYRTVSDHLPIVVRVHSSGPDDD